MKTLTGDQGYTPFRPKALAEDVDASAATFHMNQTTNPYPINIEAAASGLTMTGGEVLGEVPAVDWRTAYDIGNSAAIRVDGTRNMTLRGWRFVNCWDAIRTANADGFLIDHVWIDGARDDSIENDKVSSGIVRDSLFESFVGAMSTDGIDNGPKTVAFENCLIRSRAFAYKGRITHQSPFKTNKDNPGANPEFVLWSTVIAIEDPLHEGYERLAVAFLRMIEVFGCHFLNLSDTPLPSGYPTIPDGFTVSQGAAARALWAAKRQAWLDGGAVPEPEPDPEPEPEPDPVPDPDPTPDPVPEPPKKHGKGHTKRLRR